MRDKSDAILNDTGKRPNIFIAKIGQSKDYLARATFAKNFFEVGGFEALEGDGNDIAQIIAEFKTSQSNYAIIASSDALYTMHAAKLAAALKSAGAKYIYLAGKPSTDAQPIFTQAGVNAYIFAKSNLVETLTALYALTEKGNH
ncbi:MAG: hypothetical protein HRU28_15675 [Rhizobiales bacterium]|nr:hypothetical protein [Hyphomicrobiales bacterium]